MTADDERLLLIYGHAKTLLELCEVEVFKAREVYGNDEIIGIVSSMAEDFGQLWQGFRQRWDIPDCPGLVKP